MPMACSQSSTVPNAEDSGLPGSSSVALGLWWVDKRKMNFIFLASVLKDVICFHVQSAFTVIIWSCCFFYFHLSFSIFDFTQKLYWFTTTAAVLMETFPSFLPKTAIFGQLLLDEKCQPTDCKDYHAALLFSIFLLHWIGASVRFTSALCPSCVRLSETEPSETLLIHSKITHLVTLYFKNTGTLQWILQHKIFS